MGVTSQGPAIVSKVDGTPLLGQQNSAGSVPVVLPSDQIIPVSPTAPYTLTPLGYQQIASGGLATAVGLPSIPAGATIALINIEGNSVRYRDDGTNPTASVGMPLIQTQSIEYTGSLSAIKFIQSGAGAILNVLYYK